MREGVLKNITHFALWHFNTACNFECEYCFGHTKKEHPAVKRYSPEKIVRGFDETGFTWWIGISGGEPFLYPGLVEIVEKLTTNHLVHIDTNLSCNIEKFLDRIEPNRIVYLNCAFHIVELEKRNKVDEFIKKALLLRDAGFSIILSIVTYPPILKRLEKYIALFKSYGLTLQPKIFRGYYDEKRFRLRKSHYPESYTEEERRLIMKYSVDPVAEKLIFGLPSYKGRLCLAGKNFIRIHPDGKVNRCPSDLTSLGNIFKGSLKLFDKARICKAKFCSCPFVSRLNIIEGEKDLREDFEKMIHLNDKSPFP